MPMEKNPDYVNDAQRQLQERVIRSGEGYAADNARSKELNASRTERRKQIKDMGFRTDAYQQAVYAAKNLTPNEAKDFFTDMKMIYGWLSAKQKDLFPEEQLRAQKREQTRKDKEKKAADAQKIAESQKGVDASTNPRSDPKNGGAGGVKGRGKAKDKPDAKGTKAKSNVVPLKQQQAADDPAPPKGAAQVTSEAGQKSDAAVKESIARQAQSGTKQPGDGSDVQMQSQEREQAEGDQALKDGLPLSQSAQAAAKREQAGMK